MQSDDDHIWALRDVSFEVQRGEVLGIIGRNGAGKSTLLKILTRITAPTSGDAIMRGRVASLLGVGTGFHPELTGPESIFLNGAILGMKKAEIDRKFDEIVAFAEACPEPEPVGFRSRRIGKFIDAPVKPWSFGIVRSEPMGDRAEGDPQMRLRELVSDVEVDLRKLTEYALDSDSPTGKGKAVVFESALSFTVENCHDLVNQIRTKALDGVAHHHSEDRFGVRYAVDIEVAGANSRQAVVRTGWIIAPQASVARPITLYVRK